MTDIWKIQESDDPVRISGRAHPTVVWDGVNEFGLPDFGDLRSGSVVWVLVKTKPPLGSTDSSLIAGRAYLPDLPGRFVAVGPVWTNLMYPNQTFLECEGGWLTTWRYD